jgi:hypothetical protein
MEGHNRMAADKTGSAGDKDFHIELRVRKGYQGAKVQVIALYEAPYMRHAG